MKKDIRKTLRFSQKEYEKINEELQNANVTFSDFARSAILKKKIILPIEKDLLYELNKIGNNMNQIARAINSNEKIEVLKNEDGLYIHSESVGKVYFYFPIYDSNTGYLSGKASTSLFVIFGSLRLLAAKFFQSSTLWFRKVRRKYESIFSLG